MRFINYSLTNIPTEFIKLKIINPNQSKMKALVGIKRVIDYSSQKVNKYHYNLRSRSRTMQLISIT